MRQFNVVILGAVIAFVILSIIDSYYTDKDNAFLNINYEVEDEQNHR